ncbi:MAG: preprotein translocase subunit YajC [Oscillospiraceae bacterium]|nr:preprotein translocase subunit YajC [Oscillospiraceae bacterium]MDD7428782.1 preprotein translocase subunit YajC [Oscillospiraceae bacterium]MDY2847341.1 preprotein translocase subunit YajC [Oscillospiraceae bacterium]
MNMNYLSVLAATASTAAADGTADEASAMGSILYMVFSLGLLVLVFYFCIIRPQKKKEKEQKAMKDSLQIGDEVTTIGGITGIVVRINRNPQNSHEDTIVIETGGDRNKVRVKMWAISENATQHDAVEEGVKKS